MSDDPFFRFEDPTRVGESVMNVLNPDGPTENSGFTFEDYKTVWSKVLELAGYTTPTELTGWVPVFRPKSNSPEDVAEAKAINTFIAQVATLEGSSIPTTNDPNPYWLDMEAMWERIQEEKAKQPTAA